MAPRRVVVVVLRTLVAWAGVKSGAQACELDAGAWLGSSASRRSTPFAEALPRRLDGDRSVDALACRWLGLAKRSCNCCDMAATTDARFAKASECRAALPGVCETLSPAVLGEISRSGVKISKCAGWRPRDGTSRSGVEILKWDGRRDLGLGGWDGGAEAALAACLAERSSSSSCSIRAETVVWYCCWCWTRASRCCSAALAAA